MRQLKNCGDAGKEISQQLFDSMFADMDLSLREMGAGDIGVSKRVRIMAEAFMGRLEAYVTALDNDDRTALAEENSAKQISWNRPSFVCAGLVIDDFLLYRVSVVIYPRRMLHQ